MEYIVSARKYRPMTFEGVVGQHSISTTLKNAVKSGKLAHAYLFSGPRGVGKTTCARIFAKAINCFNPSDDGEACGHCESCESFNEQRSLNIFELDAASNNGIEHIKALIDQTRVPPQIGKYKVFIIDEVHQLSKAAFNAFLKTLEEPPSYVIFILATTEKQQLLPTIISRCQLYDFERMSVPDIIAHLKEVARKEGYQYEDEALSLIAEKADGGMRDALSIFDQTASYCQGNITYEKVVEDLNVLDVENYFQIVDFCLENRVADVMVLFNSVLSKGFDGGQLISGLSAHIRNVMMASDASTTRLIDKSDALRQRYQQQAQKCKPKFLYQALRILNDCDLNYRQSGNKRLLAELTLIEVAQITQSEDDPPGGRRPQKRLKTLFRPSAKPTQPDKSKQVTPAAEHPTRHTSKPTSAQKVLSFKSILQANNDTDSQQEATIESSESRTFTQADLRQEWLGMCNRMKGDMAGLGARMRNITPTLNEPAEVLLTLPNEELRKQIEGISKRIIKTLSLSLHNSQITLRTQVSKSEDTVSIITDTDYLAQLRQTSQLFCRMCDRLQLQHI